MNIFRLIADFLHLASFVIIVYKLHKHKSCAGMLLLKNNKSLGVSAKTQELYLIVFLTRYMDLFMYFISYYNTIMKILFITVTMYILFLMRVKVPIKNVIEIIWSIKFFWVIFFTKNFILCGYNNFVL